MKGTRSIYTVGMFILVAAMTGCATQKACSGSGCSSDDETTAAINSAIARHADLGPPSQIQVSTIDHVVYLSGSVDSRYQRSVAGSLAARTAGVSKVVNTIDTSN